MASPDNLLAQGDWDCTRQRFAAWWRHEGLILHVLARRQDAPLSSIPNVQAPFFYLQSGLNTLAQHADSESLARAWLDPLQRAALAERYLPGIAFLGDAFPYFDTHTGPGNLATFLGAEPEFAIDTVWFHPAIADAAAHPPLRFDPANPWFQRQKAILEEGMRVAAGRYLVSVPDLVENLDILAALRDPQRLMFDLVERPDWVEERIAEINRAYFAAFDALRALVEDPWGGNVFSAFHIWGEGRTAKVQCDAGAMISPRMFDRFVVPALAEQCAWLDHSLFHLDGTQALPQLDSLLALDALDAIEWTPQISLPQGGDPLWYELYRRILAAGKSVQAIDVAAHEVIPLIEAVGAAGLFVVANVASEAEGRALVEAVERIRP